MSRFAKLLMAVVIALSSISVPSPAKAESLTVAAGAGYKKMVKELAECFKQESGISVEQIYGNMGQTIAQAKTSGLVDCIIGDKRFLDKSEIAFSAMAEIGRGKLVAAYIPGVELKDPKDIVGPSTARAAMPDPKKAIYGRAASEFLKNAGLEGKLGDKLLVVATVPQVTSYLLSKEIDVGFINLTDAMGVKDKLGGYLMVDQSLYSPIIIVAGILESGPNSKAMAKFSAFLGSEKAKEIAGKHGL